MDLAKKLIDAAIDARVDAIKFQTFIAENIVSKDAAKAAKEEGKLKLKAEREAKEIQDKKDAEAAAAKEAKEKAELEAKLKAEEELAKKEAKFKADLDAAQA